MEFVIDENIPVELIPWLNERGHRTFPVAKGMADENIAVMAKERKAILLTQDRHFANTLRFPPHHFHGFIRIKIHPSYIEDITDSLTKLFEKFPDPGDFKEKLIILGKEGFLNLKNDFG